MSGYQDILKTYSGQLTDMAHHAFLQMYYAGDYQAVNELKQKLNNLGFDKIGIDVAEIANTAAVEVVNGQYEEVLRYVSRNGSVGSYALVGHVESLIKLLKPNKRRK